MLKVSERVDEKPILIWMEDHSSSMISNSDSLLVQSFLSEDDASYLEQLNSKFDVRQLHFSEQAEESKQTTITGKITNIAQALNDSKQRFYNQNVGGMVLISDGIYNRGINPVYEAQNLTFPVYSLGFGDTTVKRDVLIENLVHNEITYLNNQFPLEISIRSRKTQGEKLTVLVKNNRNQEVYKESFTVDGEDYFKKINALLTADSVGLKRYTVSVLPIDNEKFRANNTRTFNVEVIDNRKKVLILGSAPHPDMGALASSLKSLEKYEVQTAISSDYDYTEKEPDLYILHAPNDRILSRMQKSTKPYWIVYGKNVNPVSFTRFAGIKVGNHSSFEYVNAHTELGFSLFNLNPELNEFVQRLPPLRSPFGKMQLTGNNTPLFYKKVKRIETNELLWFFREDDRRRSAFIMASGVWQWRIYNYRQQKNFELFDQLVSQTVQYLTAKREDQRFVVESNAIYEDGEDIKLNARLYNLSLELTNEPDVSLEIRSDKGEEYKFEFSKLSNTYTLNAGVLPAGNYSWKASAQLGNEDLFRKGAFSIRKSEMEQSDLLARHDVLKTISTESGGKYYISNEVKELTENLLSNHSIKSIQRLETNISSILNKKWIFFLLLILMATEWGLRKYYGKY